MKKIYLISALVAVLCGILVFGYVNATENKIAKLSEEKQLKMTSVVVAKTDIPPFTPITQDMLEYAQFPAGYVPENSAGFYKEVVGSIANGTIVKGEIIMLTAVGSLEDIGNSLSYQIPDGMRAITISVGTVSGVGGYIVKGDLIDVMVYIETDDSKDSVKTSEGQSRKLPGGVVKTVLEAAQVLRTGEKGFAQDGSAVYSNLTLALSPADCEKIYAAMNQGSLYVTLRQIADDSETDTKAYSVTGLLGN